MTDHFSPVQRDYFTLIDSLFEDVVQVIYFDTFFLIVEDKSNLLLMCHE